MSLANAYLDQLSDAELAQLERCVDDFEAAWRDGERPAIDDHLPPAGAVRRAAVLELIHLDLEYNRRAGHTAGAEDYLCRYPELRHDEKALRGLLAAEQELRGESAPPAPRPAKAPEQIGKFRLLDLLGAGACGTVYRAVDTELGRTVAVKVPHLRGHPGREEVERFLREARAAAGLRHPGIVAVYDVGESAGVGFLVSEFVPGQTLAARLAAGRPGFRESAQLVAAAADALHHAHQHGVVHRDLKPSNLLIDEDGQPRLLDFGLARCEAAGSTLTIEGELLGTPAYMSPEQARGEAHHVDGRSDVWSLGVILYELLTGERPFRGNSRMVLRQVLDEEPRPPRRVNDEVPLDLETICLKALAKEPAARYPTAHELAEDLRRYLRGEPVRARPVGAVGRLRRWCRRRPLPAGLAAGLVLVTVLGFAGVLLAWSEADVQRRQAEANLDQAERERLQAEENVRQTYQAMYDLTRAALRGLAPYPAARKAVSRELWSQRLKYYENFLQRYETDPSVRAHVVRARLTIAYLTLQLGPDEEEPEEGSDDLAPREEALGLLRQMVREYPDVPEYQGELGILNQRIGYAYVKQQQYPRALPLYREARGLLQAAVARMPPPSNSLLTKNEETPQRRYRRFLALTCRLIGDEERRAGRGEAARQAYREAVAGYEQLVREQATDPSPLAGLANSALRLLLEEQKAGNAGGAEALYQRLAGSLEENLAALPAGVPAGKLVHAWYHVGGMHKAFQQRSRTARAYQRAAAHGASILRHEPDNSTLRGLLVRAGLFAGYQYRKVGQPAEALNCFQLVRAGLERCAEKAPLDRELLLKLAEACEGVAFHQKRQRPHEAVVAAQQACELFERVMGAEPTDPSHQRTLGTRLHLLGDAHLYCRHWQEAARNFQRAANLREKLVQRFPDHLVYRNDAHWSWQGYGNMLERLGQRDAAATACRQAVEHLEELVRRAPQDEEYRRRLAQRRDNLSRLLREVSGEREPAVGGGPGG